MSSASGGGDVPPSTSQQSTTNLPGQVAGHSAWAGAGALGGATLNNRTFEQIIEDEKKTRNIIEIHLIRNTAGEPQENLPRGLTFDDLGELIFDIIKINPDDCLIFNYNTGRKDIKHIQLKSNVNADPFVTTTPIEYKGYMVSVSRQLSNITRVTFKNVPLNVPNEEILHLCKSYGQPLDNKVYFETLTNSRNRGMRGSTRYVDVELAKGSSMMNYYWMEGPLSGDQGRRVLVLHNGQGSQCSHCLRMAGRGGCPAGGHGKACNMMNTPRAKIFHYMESLKTQVGYMSLKSKHVEKQARNFPSLPGFDTDISSNMEEHDLQDIVPMNPIEEKDRKIAALEKNIDTWKSKETENIQLREALTKSVAELKTVKSDHRTSLRRISFTKKVTEQKLLDSISNQDGFDADPTLIGVYSATLDEDDFDFEDGNNLKVDAGQEDRSRKGAFLKGMEEKLEPGNKEHKERFLDLKNKILENVKAAKHSRERSRSGSVASRGGSLKRELSSESLRSSGRCSPASRPRTLLPVKQQ